MKIREFKNGSFCIDCDRDTLGILNNALNNIPQAVDEHDHTTLIGATQAEAAALLKIINAALQSD